MFVTHDNTDWEGELCTGTVRPVIAMVLKSLTCNHMIVVIVRERQENKGEMQVN